MEASDICLRQVVWSWACVCVTCTLLCTTDMIVGVFAFLVLAKQVVVVAFSEVICRTCERAAGTLLGTASWDIIDGASKILAVDFWGMALQDVSFWAVGESITCGDLITTCIPVSMHFAQPICTVELSIFWLEYIAGRTRHRAALAFFTTTLVDVCIRAITVVAQDVPCILLVQISDGTVVVLAMAFRVSAIIIISTCASSISALNVPSINLENKALWGDICIAHSKSATTMIPVSFSALKAQTMHFMRIAFVQETTWTLVSTAQSFFSTTYVEI